MSKLILDPDQYYKWVEPFGNSFEPVECRMKVRDILSFQRNRKDSAGEFYKTASDQTVLEDFIVVHWAVCDQSS